MLADTGCENRGDMSGPDQAYFLRSGGLAYACGAVYLHRTPAAARETLEPQGAFYLTLFRRDGAEWLRWTVDNQQKEQAVS